MRPVYVAGVAAVTALGFDWRGLGEALQRGAAAFSPSLQLAASHGAVAASEVPSIPAQIDVDGRARKLMSHPARLAAVALRLALQDAAWPPAVRQELAFYLGVGASGASMTELTAMLDASIKDHEFSLPLFGKDGLAACNPLFAFQLMNNFTLCHGAILNDTGGPNSAFYSRGTGTVAALAEALWLVESSECDYAVAGGADSALHPVTYAQLDSAIDAVPGEGAGMLALSGQRDGALAVLRAAVFHSARAWQRDAQLVRRLLREAGAVDSIILASSNAAANARLRDDVRAVFAHATIVDVCAGLGEALAATPALAWCAAIDLLRHGRCCDAAVLSAGPDGGIGMTVLRSCP